MKNFHLTLLALFISSFAFGQMKTRQPKTTNHPPFKVEDLAPVQPISPAVPLAASQFFEKQNFWPIASLPKPVSGQPDLQALISEETGTPYLIRGTTNADPAKALNQQVQDYLISVKSVLKLDDPTLEFQIKKTETDELGYQHIRLQQQWMGVPVHGSEAILHENNGQFYLFNGRFHQSPKLANVTPTIQPEAAEQLVLTDVSNVETVKTLTPNDLHLVNTTQQAKAELVIFYPTKNEPHLTWHVTVVPNIAARYSYFVDAKTGEILSSHSEICKIAGHLHEVGSSTVGSLQSKPAATSLNTNCQLKTENFLPPVDGPATANATDLLGQSRLINTYKVGSTYFFIDAVETMFKPAQSSFPDGGVGVIWTIDAQNTSPENNNFGAVHITSSNNSWNNPKAVSAHYHAQKAYEYFKNTFGRNSINGIGGNIVSLINVVESDNSQMDNAFWNGQAMFYGNGNQAFTAPLAKALDVSGHEMSHGVIQATANLEYLNESGALNESFADIFGAMIDRDDWKMGEDITNTQFYPTGALRDLSNPHNGGNSINDDGWQPAHFNEKYTGNQDNGGVHINSGIVNKAFFLFANNGSVGKSKAEKVYYRALDQYLTKSSNFVDCRIAVVQAATDIHGANSAEVNAAKAAFDAVGIGSSGGTSTPTDIPTNPGDDYIVMTDGNDDQLYVFASDGNAVFNPLTSISPLSRPSVTDNGSVVVYIDQANKMRAITIDWNSQTFNNQIIQSSPVWYNVAISKDGSRLAALSTDNDNLVYIYDFGVGGNFVPFELYNPTTAQGGPSSDNVNYADVLEWDHTGQWVMYDALSTINTSGTPIDFWDIGFIYVWDGSNYANGYIEKLFSSLPEDVSVGNPTFSKNSDYIIAFDYFDEFNDEYNLLGANIETGDVGTIYDQGAELYWPSYSPDDHRIVFNENLSDGTEVLAFISLQNDKINPSGNASVFVEGGRQGVWFADGNRALAANDLVGQNNIRLYPNPVGGLLNLDFSTKKTGDVQVQVFDLMGRLVLGEIINANAGENHHRIATESLASGQYFVRISMAEGQAALKFLRN